MKNKELKQKFDWYLDKLSEKHHTGELLEKDIYIDEVWDDFPDSMKFGVLVDFYASEGLLCFIGYNVGDGTHVGIIYVKGEKEPEWLEKHISEEDAREAIVDVAPQVWEKINKNIEDSKCYCGKEATHTITVEGFDGKEFYRCKKHAAVNPNKQINKNENKKI